MKLAQRQKVILLASFFLFLLLLVITTTNLIISKSKKKNSLQVSENSKSPQAPLPSDKQDLERVKRQAISEVETLLNNNQSVKTADLLRELKTSHGVDIDNWHNYLSSWVSVNTQQELENRKNKLLTIISNLAETPIPDKKPGKSPPSPPSPPSPSPSTPPTNKWEKILWEIEKFMRNNPQTLQEVKDFVKKYPDPIREAGIKLEGVGIDELKGLTDGGKVPGLNESNSGGKIYKDWVQLSAAGDGNCFLNSYSVFLTGKNGDTSCALPLRVKMCLELMINTDAYFPTSNEAEMLDGLKTRLIKEEIAINGKWLANTHIEIMSFILKRPLAVVSRITDEDMKKHYGDDFYFNQFPEGILACDIDEFFKVKKYDERWVIYNSGGHFQPLIKK